MEPQTRALSKGESGHSFTPTFRPEVITVFPSPLLRKSLTTSQRFWGVDQTPLPPSRLRADFLLGAYRVWTKLPGEMVHFSLESSQGKTTRGLGLWGEVGPRIPSGGMLLPLVLSLSLLWCSPAGGSRGQNGWNLTGTSRNVVEILSSEILSNTQRRRTRNLFDAGGPR
jgi:hypothetical protein